MSLDVSWTVFGSIDLSSEHTKTLSDHTDHRDGYTSLGVTELVIRNPGESEGYDWVDAACDKNCSCVSQTDVETG